MSGESLKGITITEPIDNKVSTLKRLIFVTGPPGIGKTSVLLRSANGLKNRRYKIGGMISRDVREGGVRDMMRLAIRNRSSSQKPGSFDNSAASGSLYYLHEGPLGRAPKDEGHRSRLWRPFPTR